MLVMGIALVFGLQLVMADSGALHQVIQNPPIQLGTSGGNINDISSAFCCSGTLGSLVTKGRIDYILSNNHVLDDTGTATIGDSIIQPGLVDVGCIGSQAQVVANLSQAVPLGTTANVDAAIAQIISGQVDTTGAILDIGVPASTTAPIDSSALGRGVAKSGRTTGLTCASIGSISTNVKVQYQAGCGSGPKFFVTYTHQVLVNSSSFSAGGDSGSLIVTSDTAQPIALLFAGSSTTTIGNRISDVTSALGGVSFVGGNTHAVTCPSSGGGGGGGPRPKGKGALSPAAVARATAVKEKYAQGLMADPAVIGVGVGASSADPSETVVVIYLEQGRLHGPIPSELDGVRTEVIRTDAFRAYGWNEPGPKTCSVK
jgi:hypothetical protein